MNKALILNEIKLKAIRASGSGGQHVNKVSTKIELSYHLFNSEAFSTDEKERLLIKLKKKLTKDGLIIIYSQDSRSQVKNRKVAVSKLFDLLTKSLIKRKKRKKTLPSKKEKEKRLQSKKIQAEKKSSRRKPIL